MWKHQGSGRARWARRLVVAACACLPVGGVRGAAVTWAVDANGLWTTPGDWSGGVLPDSTSDVTISRPAGEFLITLNTGTQSIHSLITDEQLLLSGGTLAIATTMQVNDAVTLSGGIVSGGTINFGTAGALVLGGSAGTLNSVQVNGDLLMNTSSASVVVAGTTRFNAARLSNSSAGLRIAPGYTLNDLVSVEGAATGARNIALAVGGSGTVTFAASAVVRLAASSGGDLNISNSSISTLVNNGLISAEAAGRTLAINNSVFTNNGSLAASNSSTLNIGSTSWSNAGTINVTAATLTFGGAWSNAAGSVSVNNSTVNLGGTFTTAGLNLPSFTNTSSTINLTGTLTNSTLTLNAATGSWNLLAGTISGGTVNLADGSKLLLTSNSGTLTDVTYNGEVALDTTSSAVIVGGSTRFTAARLTANAANLRIAPGYTLNDLVSVEGATTGARNISLAVGGTGTVTLAASAVVRLASTSGGDLNISNSSSATLVNNGLISAEAAGRNLAINTTSFTNNGTVQVTAGTITISATNWTNAGPMSAATATTLTLNNAWSNSSTITATGATLNLGSGTSAWSNTGMISATNCTTTLDGAFTLAGLGTFNRSGGTVNLDGTLTNTSTTFTLNATTGSWNLTGGTINGGTINETGGAALLLTSSGGTLSSVQVNAELLLDTTSASVTVGGTTRFTTARLSANAASFRMAPGYTLNDPVSVEGATTGARNIQLGFGGTGTVTFAGATTVRLASSSGGDVNISNSSSATLVNNGLISAEAAGRTLSINTTGFTNNGTLQVTAGTMIISASNWSNAGSISAATATTLTLNNVWSNSATITATGATLNLGSSTSAWSNTGTISATNCTTNLGGAFTLAALGTFTRSGGTVNLTGTLTNTSATLTLDATTGSWNLMAGTINGGTVNDSTSATLLLTSSAGTLSSVQVNGELLLDTTSAAVVVGGTTRFGAARLSANAANFRMAPGYTLNDLISVEGAVTGARNIQLGFGGTGTVTFAGSAVVRLASTSGGDVNISNSSSATLVNNGTISAEAAGRTLTINNTAFTNNGTVQATGGGTVNVVTIPSNFSSGTLTGGTWNAFANSTLNLSGLAANITTNAASVTLSGTGSTFARLTNALSINNGDLHFLASRSLTLAGALTNSGLIELGGGTLLPTSLTNGPAATLIGFGTVALRPANSGTVEATGGTLLFADGVNGPSGTITIASGGTLDISGGSSGTSTGTLNDNGSLILGNNNVLVSSSYMNANFGAGNTFNKHAGVTTTGGQIQANGNNVQTLSGSITGGATGTPAMAFGNVHVGDVVNKSFQITNSGTSGPAVLYAIQTTTGGGNITDARLGVTAQNLGPVALGAASPAYSVTLTASASGSLTGQALHIANNFDNISEQTLSITGTAYNLAAPSVPAVNLGIVHVGVTASGHLSISNTAANNGFSENLVASVGGQSGAASASGGPVTVGPGASNTTAVSVVLDTSVAALGRSGTVTLHVSSDGTGSSGLGTTALSDQIINVSADVLNFAIASMQKTSGSGTFTLNDPTHATLDFGVMEAGTSASVVLGVNNTAAGPADTLAGAWTNNAPAFSLTNFTSFSGVVAGASQGGLQVGFSPAIGGLYSQTVILHPLSQDAAPFSGALGDFTLTLTGLVNPFSSTWDGSVGNWSQGTHWSTSPNAPSNGMPASVEYAALVTAGQVTLDQDFTVRALAVSGGNVVVAAHTLTLASNLTVSGGTVSQTGGTLSVHALNQSGGVVSLGGTQVRYDLASLSMTAGTAALTGGTKKVVAAGSIALSGTARLDLANGGMIVHSTAGTIDGDVATLRGDIGNGLLETSLASGITGLGVMKAGDLMTLQGAGATFLGQTIGANDVLVRYTYLGDADFSGTVNLSDYALIDSGFYFGGYNGVTSVAQWVNGDFNGDKVVTWKDYALIDAAFAAGGSPLAADEISAHSAEFGAPYVSELARLDAAIPEPASLATLGWAAIALLARRRK